MAICEFCNQEMSDNATTTCTGNDFVKFEQWGIMKRVPYNNEYFPTTQDEIEHRCHDCGVALGGIHHYGCDMEVCPRCGDQFAFCDCGDRLIGGGESAAIDL